MRKKKILFVMTSLGNGGIATSLKNLLVELDKEKIFEIHLLLFELSKTDIDELPSSVKVLEAGKFINILAVSQRETFKRNVFLGILRTFLGIFTKIFSDKLPYWLLFRHSNIEMIYDTAISCTQSAPKSSLYGGCNEYILECVKSKKKISFIHCDFVKYGLNNQYSYEIYKKFDNIACVSNSVKGIFESAMPALKSKMVLVRNCYNYKKILEMSQTDTFVYAKDRLQILTVARIAKEKGHIRFLNVLYNLKCMGYDFEWHVVGSGNKSLNTEVKRLVKKFDLDNNVKFYGDQINPYRFMKNIDLLAVPSIHEAAPMVFYEAIVLGVPVFTTNTSSANEMIGLPGYGVVCDNDENGILSALINILNDKKSLEYYKININNKFIPGNEEAIEEFLKII